MTYFAFLLQTATGSNPVMSLLLPLALVAIFYLLVFMPMQKQKKRQAEMLKNLKSGDVVTTTGGITGTIVSADEDTIVLRVKPDNIKLQFSRAAVNALVLPEDRK